jgi:hypothetical protein
MLRNILKFLIREIVYFVVRLNIIKPLHMGNKKQTIIMTRFYFCFNFLRDGILRIYYSLVLPIKNLLKPPGT